MAAEISVHLIQSWWLGCGDARSEYMFFFSCFFFAQRHHIQIAQAVNSMAFS
jgi:hypothetical protein